jgi:uncharacterized protein involved in exopolysaccharide biosynthesis
MNTRDLVGHVRPYWRVGVVAVLGGLLAYLGSYIVSPTYVSSTQLLIRARESTVPTSTGQNLQGQPVIDSTLTTALGETQSAVVSSPAVAIAVVDQLGLDQPKPQSQSIVAKAKRAFSGTFKRAKAYVTHGFYAEPNTRDAAIQEVQSGLSAKALKDSYVLQVSGSADTAQGAADVTNAAADALVGISTARFQEEAAKNRDFLAGQVTKAQNEVAAATAAKNGYEKANGITDPEVAQSLSSESQAQLEQDLRDAQANAAATQAQLDEANSRLASTDPTVESSSQIETGRSTTGINTTQQSAAYQALLVDRNRLEGEHSGYQARVDLLTKQLAGSSDPALSDQQAGLAPLQQAVDAAEKNFQTVSADYQTAVMTADQGSVEVTRIDEAQVPTFPVKPLRYIYLGLGLLCGALAGWGLTWLHRRKQSGVGGHDDEVIDLTDGDAVPVSANGADHGDGAEREGELVTAPARTQVGRYEIFRPDPAEGP